MAQEHGERINGAVAAREGDVLYPGGELFGSTPAAAAEPGGEAQLARALIGLAKVDVNLNVGQITVNHTGLPGQDPGVKYFDRDMVWDYPFKGTFHTQLVDGKLLIPQTYIKPLGTRGVITAGLGKHLMLFGSAQWRRMKTMIGNQAVGLDVSKNTLVAHLYGRAQEFDVLYENSDTKRQNPFMLLNRDLIDYAKLEKNIVMVGVMYHAQVYSREAHRQALVDPDSFTKQAKALPQA